MNHFRLLAVCGLLCLSAGSALAQGGKEGQAALEAAYLKGRELAAKGKHAEAVPFFEMAVELAPAVFGLDHANTAAIMNTLGLSCLSAAQFKKALAAFEGSTRIHQKNHGKDHELVAQGLGNAAETLRRLARFSEAEPLYLRALEIEEAKLGKDHPDVLITVNNLAVLYHSMGRLKDAEPLMLRTLRAREAKLGERHPNVAKALTNLAAVYQSLGRHREAEAMEKRALSILEENLGKEHLLLAGPLNSLGNLYVTLGRAAEGEAHLTRSLRVREAHLPKDHPDLAPVLNNLGLAYTDLERYAEAESAYLRSLAILERHLGKEHEETSNVLNNLGNLYFGLGRHKEAEAAFLRSLAACEKAHGKGHIRTAPTLSNLGGLYNEQERYAEAEPLLARALEITEKTLGPNHPDVGAQTNNLAQLYLRLDRFDRAEELYRRSLENSEKAFGPEHPSVCTLLTNLGGMCLELGRLKEAETLLLRAMAMTEKWNADKLADSIVYRRLAEVNFRLGRHEQALRFQDKSLNIFQQGIDSVFAFSTEKAMYEFVGRSGGSLPSLLAMASAAPGEAGARIGLEWTLKRKGIILETTRRFRQTQELLSGDDPLRGRVEEYRALKQKIADAILAAPEKDPEGARKQLAEWRKQLETLEGEVNRGLAKALPTSAGAALGIDAVRKRLPAEAALVDVVRCPLSDFKVERATKVRYFAFVLLPGDSPPRMIDLGDAAAIDKAVAALRQEFIDFQEKLKECESDDEVKALEKTQEKQFHKTSKALHALVVAPLRKALGSATMVYLAPDGELSRFPFECLVDDEGKYLVERFQLAYLSSGRDLLRPEAAPARGTVVFANPDFRLDPAERKDLAAKLLGKKADKGFLVASRGPADTRSVGWKALPGAAAEAKDIEKLLSASAYGPVRTLQGAEALEEMLKGLPAPPRVLHLATHGFFIDHDPDARWKDGEGAGWARGRLKAMDNPLLRSGIVLAGANTVGEKDRSTKVEDGWVTAEEIALVNLRGTELVVLSACQTGLGDLKTGEGVSGLRWAFLYAGARTLVTSLFEVPDTETRDLMKHFYSRLKTHGKLEALHGAQLALIQQRRESHRAAHPFFWASFVLVGDPR